MTIQAQGTPAPAAFVRAPRLDMSLPVVPLDEALMTVPAREMLELWRAGQYREIAVRVRRMR